MYGRCAAQIRLLACVSNIHYRSCFMSRSLACSNVATGGTQQLQTVPLQGCAWELSSCQVFHVLNVVLVLSQTPRGSKIEIPYSLGRNHIIGNMGISVGFRGSLQGLEESSMVICARIFMRSCQRCTALVCY